MSKPPRPLYALLFFVLIVSVFALAFVAYTQHQDEQRWHNRYTQVLTSLTMKEPNPTGNRSQGNATPMMISGGITLTDDGGYMDNPCNCQTNYKEPENLLALRLTHFGNVTDIRQTEFMNSKHEKIMPLEIELYSGMDYVAFWFNRDDISDRQVLIHLPNWNDYRPVTLPFVECFPGDQHCSSHLGG